MQPRIDYGKYAPEAWKAMLELEKYIAGSSLDRRLIHLLKMRASQINGCAFCVAFHVAEAQRLGVAADKLHMLVAWREAPVFDPTERAALAWTEALTLIPHGVPDAVYEQARAAFSDRTLACLTSAVLAINAWNRIAIAYRFAPLPIPAAGGRKTAA